MHIIYIYKKIKKKNVIEIIENNHNSDINNDLEMSNSQQDVFISSVLTYNFEGTLTANR